jgi:hypothetical protein
MNERNGLAALGFHSELPARCLARMMQRYVADSI